MTDSRQTCTVSRKGYGQASRMTLRVGGVHIGINWGGVEVCLALKNLHCHTKKHGFTHTLPDNAELISFCKLWKKGHHIKTLLVSE